MPADRFLHKRSGHGERSGSLSPLEWQVWTVYMLAADDFGVMWCDPTPLINACPSLADQKVGPVKRALEAVIKTTLIKRFEHQGRAYVFQPDWQDFQKIEWPQATTLPPVPAERLSECTDATQRLFSVWPGQKRVPADPNSTRRRSDSLATDSPEPSESVATQSVDRAKGYGYGYGNGNGSEGGAGETIPDSGEGRLWDVWRAGMLDAGVHLRLTPTANEFSHLRRLCELVPDEPKRQAVVTAFSRLTPDQLKASGAKAKTLGWVVPLLPSLLASAGEATKPCKGRHKPPCPDDVVCTRKRREEDRQRALNDEGANS